MRSPRPRDAASLVLIRREAGTLSVLMGKRTTRDAWSERFVFPGGRVDPHDARVPAASDLKPEVEARLLQGCSPARARAIAIAAIRETFEETGLAVAAPLPDGLGAAARRDPVWARFASAAQGPALDRLHLLCRAITPPQRPKRFNARFFLADAGATSGELRSNGELHELGWYPLDDARRLPLPLITSAVLQELQHRLASATLVTPGRTPLFRTIGSRHQRLEE